MTGIDKMSDEQKSMLLLKVSGQVTQIEWIPINLYEVDPETGEPLHMPEGWRVLNWISGAEDTIVGPQSFKKLPVFLLFDRWWRDKENFITQESPGDAQRLFLDKILALCIASGLVTLPAQSLPPQS